MSRSLCSAIPAALLMAAACADTPAEPPRARLRAAHDAGVIASVTGNGHAEFNGAPRTFSFHAVKRSDGRVTGTFLLIFHSGTFESRAHGAITCLSVVGNRAWLAIDFERTNFRWLDQQGLSVVDNGEGKDAPADMVSAGSRLAGEAYCAAKPLVAVRPVLRGNLQVREY